MSSIIDNVTGGYKSSAKVNAGTLVLSLPDAITPVVWRMDLSTAKSSAIEVRENEDGFYDLVLKTPKADAHNIAVYEFKIKATQALMAVTKAMSKCEYYSGESNLSKRHLPVPVYAPRPRTKVIKVATYAYIVLSLAAFGFFAYSIYDFTRNNATPVTAKSYSSYETNKTYDKNYENFLSGNDLEQPKVTKSAPAPKKVKTGEVMSADDFLKKR